MTVHDLELFYDYNYWANTKLLSVVSRLTAEDFTKTVAGGHGSVRNTLVHVLSTEWGWLSRCGGKERGPKLQAGDYPTAESLIKQWEKVENYMRTFLSGLADQDLGRHVAYPGKNGARRSMLLGELLHHSIIHGAHHRGQVAVLLRELGYTPPTFDILFYYAEKNGVPAW